MVDSPATDKPEQLGFIRQFVLPALLVFLVPTIGLFFFLHAQSRYDAQLREAIVAQIREDPEMPAEEKSAAILFFEETPASTLLADPDFAASLDPQFRFEYLVFRWLIRLAAASIVASVAVFAIAGVSVLCSLNSQRAQYVSLSLGWHVLRAFGTIQVVVQGALLVALSFWITALWFNVYVPKLILLVALLALTAVVAIVKTIFRKPEIDFAVEGELVHVDHDAPLWEELRGVCERVGTEPPDQVIAGIDDNFFVTEQPTRLGESTLAGRTLFVSLSLLKQLDGDEAEAVMAHEMAHFSGQDTLYSKKITPLLVRYGAYLEALSQGFVSLPIFYFMVCFRGLYEMSLKRLSRQREFRADRIAAEATSSEAIAGALLRIAAYSSFRASVEKELFEREEVLDQADILARIEQGFHDYAAGFLEHPDVGRLQTAHPFDSHPPLEERLAAQQHALHSDFSVARYGAVGDGRWFGLLPEADRREREQWQAYEQRFRDAHEQILAYRYGPDTPEQEAIVEKYFPEVNYTGKTGKLAIDFEKLRFEVWEDAVRYDEITNVAIDDKGVFTVSFKRDRRQSRKIKLIEFQNDEYHDIVDSLQKYYGRFLAAREFRQSPGDEAT